jgi:PST family polysaccharide transporter
VRTAIVNAVIWSATRTGGQAFVSFLVLVTLARLLDPKSFGLVAMATVFTELILMIQDQGFDQAIIQRQELEDTHLDTAFWVSLVTGCLLTGCGQAIAGPVSQFFGEPQVAPIVRWLSLCFLFVSVGSTQNAILRRSLKMKQLAVRSLSATVIGGCVAMGMALTGFGVWSLVARGLVSTLLESAIVWFLSDWRPRCRFRWHQFVELFTFGMSIVGKRIVTVVHRRCDAFVIGLFLGPTPLGYYTIGNKLIFTIRDLITGISGPVVLPAFSRMQHHPDRLLGAFLDATRLTSFVAFPAFLGLAAVGHVFIPALYGDRWAQSIPIVQMLALVGILEAVSYYHGSAMVAAGKPSWNLGVKLVTTACNVVALLIAARWGIVAVAAAFVISSFVAAPVSLLAVRRFVPFDLRTYLRQFVVPLMASSAMVAVVFGFRQVLAPIPGAHGQLGVLVVAGAVTYLLVLQVAAPSLTAQVVELLRLLRPHPKET